MYIMLYHLIYIYMYACHMYNPLYPSPQAIANWGTAAEEDPLLAPAAPQTDFPVTYKKTRRGTRGKGRKIGGGGVIQYTTRLSNEMWCCRNDWPGLCLFLEPRVLSANRVDLGFFHFYSPPFPIFQEQEYKSTN